MGQRRAISRRRSGLIAKRILTEWRNNDEEAAAVRLHPNVLAAALANKLARIAWTVLAQQRSYEARLTKAAA